MRALFLLSLAISVMLAFRPPARQQRPGSGREGKRRTKPSAQDPPVELVLDLAASLLESGLPLNRVLQILGTNIPHCAPLRGVCRCLEMNMDWNDAWNGTPSWLAPLRRALYFTRSSGASASQLLHNSAALQRRERIATAQRVGAQFGTKLVLPLGLCALPAFIALGVIPLIVALLPQW